MNEALETLNATHAFPHLPAVEGLEMRACKVEHIIAANVAETLEA